MRTKARTGKKPSRRQRCWNFRVKPPEWEGRRLCYRLADTGKDICSTCAIGGMDPG